jgi:serine protease inhibitor ecotin
MAEAPISTKRQRGHPYGKTGLIGVYPSKTKYYAAIRYEGRSNYLGRFATKEKAGIAYDRVAIAKCTDEVSYTLNYPNMTDPEREEALKVEEPVQRKRGTPHQSTGLIGVSENGQNYQARIRYGNTLVHLGTFDTKERAGLAYDQFVVDKSTAEVSFTLNYPKMSDAEREEALKVEEPVQEKRGTPNPKTGLIGVYMRREKYQAQITFGGKQHHLGTFETKEQAGMAYDRFVVDKSTEEVFYTLNYPNMSDPEREEALKVEPPKKRKRGQPNQKTGLIGVYLKRKMYQASIWIGGKQHVLGRFDKKEQAGMVYDRFVVDKSTDAVSYNLNYPNMSDQEREEALDVEAPPKKKRKRGTPKQTTGGGGGGGGGDDESDEEEAGEPTPSFQAPPIFERDPMLDQLFADAQNNKQQQQDQVVRGMHVH